VSEVVNLLQEHISRPVILADQAAPKPPYPFISIKETSSFIPQPGQQNITDEPLPQDIRQVATSQPTKVLSVTIYSDSFQTAETLSQQVHDWFSFSGHQQLKETGFVVADVTAITNRDSLIVDDYERRRGFDVTLRFVHSMERFVETIEIVAGKLRGHDYEVKRSE